MTGSSPPSGLPEGGPAPHDLPPGSGEGHDGPPESGEAPRAHRRALPLLLFVLATLSVLYTGAQGRLAELYPDKEPPFELAHLALGASYAASLMSILLAHEFGHYFAARIRRVPASLPYFLPMPFSPFGTWGAVIAMPERITSRRALLEIGAAGPLAGMTVAIPLLVVGLRLSEVKPLAPGALMEGQCLLYLAIKRVVLGPIPDGYDVFLHPVAFAGWAGLFVTMINLLPYSQLDGGHIAYALLGPVQNRIGRWVRWATLPLFLYNLTSQMAPLLQRGFTRDSVSMAVSNSIFWLVWFGMLSLMARVSGPDHPPTEPGESLGPVRTVIAVVCLVLFLLLFMPSPLVLT